MAPRIRIPAHVFGYSLAIAPAVAYAMYWKRNHKSDLELEEILNENYSTKIQGNRDKKEQMVKFFAAMKDPSTDPQQEKKMQEVLYGGKGDMKRHYAVDEKLYGTQEGVEQRRKMAEKEKEEEEEKEQIMKKQKVVARKSRDSSGGDGDGSSSNHKKKQKSKKKKQESIVDEQHEKDRQFDHAPIIEKDSTVATTTTTTAAAVGTVGILALATILLTGSKRT